jgi:hypothetical protein
MMELQPNKWGALDRGRGEVEVATVKRLKADKDTLGARKNSKKERPSMFVD